MNHEHRMLRKAESYIYFQTGYESVQIKFDNKGYIMRMRFHYLPKMCKN